MILYKTLAKEAEAEQTIEKSRFIVHVKPVETREKAEAFIASIRSKYKDATHNVPAMVIGDKFQIQWASDNGEPQGTSGAPIVQMLVNMGVTNAAVVVTRYFGGTKLGTGGLVRAYTSTAALGINAAGVREVKKRFELVAMIKYKYYPKLQNMSENGIFEITDVTYEDEITVRLESDAENSEKMRSMLRNLTSGGLKIVSETFKTS